MAISPARVAAFDILLRVETESAFAVELLHSQSLDKLSPVDRNLAMQLVMGTLRWQSRLDDAVAPFATGKNQLSRMDAQVRTALRLAVFQLRYLDRVPQSAAVNDSVDLVKKAGKSSAAPLVNAVLRKVAAAPTEDPPPFDSAQHLARALAHPLWLVERWIAQYGIDRAIRICEHDQALPQTALRIAPGVEAEVERELRDEGIELLDGALLRSARRVKAGDIVRSKAFRERRVLIQDEASQLVAALFGSNGHGRILDCCAAPGNKTLAIAQRNPQSRIVAAELHPQRARLLREMVPAPNVEVVNSDVRDLPPQAGFDAVLADVPCSGTGTLARNPEIKWKLTPADLADLHDRQVEILAAALQRAKPGGQVIYSTCSLEVEENQAVVQAVMERMPDARLLPINNVLEDLAQAGELASVEAGSLTDGDFLRTIPGVHPCDGFFAAILTKIQ